MRVISGKFRSRRLQSLSGADIRPTSDRLRETLFDILAAGNPAALEGTTWIDLYAGTGAVGIEALSRGATMICFVESSRRAAELIRKNLKSLSSDSNFEILHEDSGRALARLQRSGIRADFVYLDPPYRMEQAYRATLEDLSDLSLLKSQGIAIAEHQKKFDPGERFGKLERYRKLVQGDAALSFYRLPAASS